ncbi:MAG: riboflavin synthase [Pseudomonadota bacterium]
MFTGLVEDIGSVLAVRPEGAGRRLTLAHHLGEGALALGDSIAVDGICLTAEAIPAADRVEVTAGQETVGLTTLASWRPGRAVHLERALALGDRLGGHIVQGHVDGVATLERREVRQESLVLWLRPPADLNRYIVVKGGVALDGVSLTVNEVASGAFRVNLIPHTAAHTRFPGLAVGAPLNLEVDVLARYVEGLLGRAPTGGGLDLDRLRRNGLL